MFNNDNVFIMITGIHLIVIKCMWLFELTEIKRGVLLHIIYAFSYKESERHVCGSG